MKRLWIAFVFLGIAVSICVFEQYTVITTYKTLDAMIDQAIEYSDAQDYETATEICGEIEAVWEDKYPKLTAVADHGLIDEAGLSVFVLEESALNSDEDLTDSLLEAKSRINAVYQYQRITFGNIF